MTVMCGWCRCVCVRVGVCTRAVHMYVCVHSCGGQRLALGIFLSHSLLFYYIFIYVCVYLCVQCVCMQYVCVFVYASVCCMYGGQRTTSESLSFLHAGPGD